MVLPERFQSCDPEGTGHHHLLLLVIRRRYPFEYLESVESNHTAFSFVWNHSSHCLVQDTRRGAEMVGPSRRVSIHPLSEVGEVLQFVAVE